MTSDRNAILAAASARARLWKGVVVPTGEPVNKNADMNPVSAVNAAYMIKGPLSSLSTLQVACQLSWGLENSGMGHAVVAGCPMRMCPRRRSSTALMIPNTPSAGICISVDR